MFDIFEMIAPRWVVKKKKLDLISASIKELLWLANIGDEIIVKGYCRISWQLTNKRNRTEIRRGESKFSWNHQEDEIEMEMWAR